MLTGITWAQQITACIYLRLNAILLNRPQGRKGTRMKYNKYIALTALFGLCFTAFGAKKGDAPVRAQEAYVNQTTTKTVANLIRTDSVISGTLAQLTSDLTNAFTTVYYTKDQMDTAFEGVATKDTTATEGNFAVFDDSGDIVGSDYNASSFATAAQGTKADNAVKSVTGPTTGNLTVSTSDHAVTITFDDSSYLTSSDVSGKADKVQNATANHLAALDTNGNLVDSGIAKADVVTDVSDKVDKVQLAQLGADATIDDLYSKVNEIINALNNVHN